MGTDDDDDDNDDVMAGHGRFSLGIEPRFQPLALPELPNLRSNFSNISI